MVLSCVYQTLCDWLQTLGIDICEPMFTVDTFKYIHCQHGNGEIVPKKIRRAEPKPYHHGDLRHALIETALQLVTEEQDWTFSLREVARRAEVSHRAPYNHFPEKLDLLAAVAAVGFDRLHDGLVRATAGIDAPEALLDAICRTYVHLGLENPALYRLMFGPVLSGAGDRPTVARSAGDRARAVLEDAILRGARGGVFAVSADNPHDVILAAFAAWSAVHGLTMLVIDMIPKAVLSLDDMIDRLLRMIAAGLRTPGAKPSSETAARRANVDRSAPSAPSPGVIARGKARAMK
jgi:AcrR family transcriptional regulator